MSGLTVKFNTTELDILVSDLATAPLRAQVECALAVRKAARTIEREAKALAPVRTGHLKNSIHSQVRGLAGFVRASTSYANYVEYGTSEMAPEPYMRPAAERGYSVLAEGAADAGEHSILR
jgi:HK97 gp10 family phage protein